MALRFFYRNQKIVFVVMVLLMIAFLVPSTIRGCGQRDPGKTVIGHSGSEKITVRMVGNAAGKINLLRDYVRIREGQFSYGLEQDSRFSAFLTGCGDNAALGWILLLREAREMGVRIDEAQVDSFLAQYGLAGKAYQRLLATLREARITEKHLRQAVEDYLMILGAFDASRTTAPPPLEEMRYLFRDLKEQVELAMVVFPAEEFARAVGNPDRDEVEDRFEQYVGVQANDPMDRRPFGFGYRLPPQADVAYLLVDRSAVERAAEPSEGDIANYWNQHRDELTRTVEVPAPTRPATAPASGPAAQPAPQTREVVITKLSEAWPEIREILLPAAVDAKTNGLLQQAKNLVKASSRLEDPYAAAAGAMVAKALTEKARQALVAKAEELRKEAKQNPDAPGGKDLIDQANALDAQAGRADVVLLEKPVGRLEAGTVKLEDLIKLLAGQSGVKIIYPTGTHGRRTLAADLDVEVKGEWARLKLGDVLAKITEAVKYEEIEWVTCRGFPSTIFPAEPVNLVPVRAGRTGLVNLAALARDEVLGAARMTEEPRSRPLVSIVATAAAFQGPEPKVGPLIAPGDDFRQAMFLSGDAEGRLLWRLVAANRSYSPEKPTSEILEQIVKDFKTEKGYEMALAAARSMLQVAKAAPMYLEKFAQADNRPVLKTGPVTRKSADVRSGQIYTSFVAEVGVNQGFLDKAFAMVPAEATKPATDRPADVVELPRQRKVVLIQRIGYRPVTREEFDKMVVGQRFRYVRVEGDNGPQQVPRMVNVTLSELLYRRRRQRDLETWFVWEDSLGDQEVGIEPRVGFTPKSD